MRLTDSFLLLTILLLVGMLLARNQTLDIHVHDTYYVILHRHVFLFLGMLLFFQWVIYFLLRQYALQYQLTWFHLVITVLFIGFIAYSLTSSNRFARYIDLNSSRKIAAWALLAFVVAQLLWIVNIVFAIIKGKHNS